MSAAIIDLNAHPDPDPASLIADFGHPNWPGWWAVMALLIVMQAYNLFQPVDITQLRPRPPGPGVSRVARGANGRSGRAGQNLKTAGGLK